MMTKRIYTKRKIKRKAVNVLVTEQEKAQIVQFAMDKGVSISEYIRMSALGIQVPIR